MISSLTAEDVAERTVKPRNLTVRKAAMRDIGPMLEVINDYAAKGIMLPRTEFEMSENMRDFSVVYSGDELLGKLALFTFTRPDHGRSAVHSRWRNARRLWE